MRVILFAHALYIIIYYIIEFYRKILHVSPRSSASKMFVDNNIPNFEAFLRKGMFSFTFRLSISTKLII